MNEDRFGPAAAVANTVMTVVGGASHGAMLRTTEAFAP